MSGTEELYDDVGTEGTEGEEVTDPNSDDLDDNVELPEGEDDDAGEGEETTYRSQEEVDQAIERRLQRERKKLAKMFGVSKLDEISPYVQAGQSVVQASGLTPKEVADRMAAYRQQQGQQGQTGDQGSAPGNPALDQKLNKIESMIEEDKVTRVRQQQEAEAKKEFGDLYMQNKDDIEDKAEDLGLSLVDAAAIVLRPKMKEHLTEKQRKKQELRSKRKIEGSGGPPTDEKTPSSQLTEAQKKIADRYGIGHDKYYAQMKRRGKI